MIFVKSVGKGNKGRAFVIFSKIMVKKMVDS